LRTTKALVSAAKLMLMAARATQIPVEAGGGAGSSTARNSPSAGTRLRQPPLPELVLERERSPTGSILGGS